MIRGLVLFGAVVAVSTELLGAFGLLRRGPLAAVWVFEYPFQALLRERAPDVRFVHVGVGNASARYSSGEEARVCAVLCPDCAGVEGKAAQYSGVGPAAEIGRFLLFE